MKIAKKISLLFLTTCFCWGQTPNHIAIGLRLDNDLYTSLKNDRYYTNGMALFVNYLNKKKSPEVLKKITEFRIEQQIFTPRTRLANDIKDNDRPFAGYLFGAVTQTSFTKKEEVYQRALHIGVVGPNAMAEEVQNNMHAIFSFRYVEGWQNQIKNMLAVQTQFGYSKKIFPATSLPFFDTHLQTNINLGTVHTAISGGFFARIGLKKLQPLAQSNFYDGGALGTSNTEELYFFVHPSLHYQWYDATIQGSIFGSKSPVEHGLIPWRINTAFGIKYRYKNFNCNYTFFYRSKEVSNPTNTGYYYGSIGVSL